MVTYVPKAYVGQLAEQFTDNFTQPYVFQEFIQGSNIRTFVIGDMFLLLATVNDLPDDFRLTNLYLHSD